VFVPVGLFFGADLFLMDPAIRLVVVDAQHLPAVWILASSAFGGCFQRFFHGYSLHMDFPHRDLTEGYFPGVEAGTL